MNHSRKFREDSLLVYGKQAVLTLWQKRPQDIIRVYVEENRLSWVKDLLKYCAQEKKAYHVVKESELESITQSTHHEGLAVLAKKKPVLSFEAFLKRSSFCGPMVFVDDVQNPHNLGAITRTMAHFGASYLLGTKLPSLSAAWMRTSEGGIEHVEVVQVPSYESLTKLKAKGVALAILDIEGTKTLYDPSPLPSQILFILGNEIQGVSKEAKSKADLPLQIPGSGLMQSLNVSVACALCLGEWFRQKDI